MADKRYEMTFDMSDGTQKTAEFTVPQGQRGMSYMRCTSNLTTSTTSIEKSTLSGDANTYDTLYIGEQIVDNAGKVFVVQETTTSQTIKVAYKYSLVGPQGPQGEPNERLKETDTRSTNQTPQWYLNNYGKSIVTEFKQCATIGVNSILSGTYCNLTTIVPWGNNTGGLPVQFATNSNSNAKIAYRVSNSGATGWGAWGTLGAQGAPGAPGAAGVSVVGATLTKVS